MNTAKSVLYSRRFYQYFSTIVLVSILSIMLVSCTPPVKNPQATPTETNRLTLQPAPSSQIPFFAPASPVVSPALIFMPIGDKTILQGDVFELTLYALNPNGDCLIFNAYNLPAGATLNSITGDFYWVPQSIGSYSNISFTVSDGQQTISQKIIITVVPNIPVLISQASTGTPALIVFYYGIHTPTIDSRIIAAEPQYVIINSENGLWGQISGRNILKDLSAYKSAKIKVIGYLTSGYEGSGSAGNIDAKWYTLEMNLHLIKQMAESDRVDGVFIDECSPFPDQRAQSYLKALTDLAHNYGLITWGNVGLAQFDSWFFTRGGFDLMQSDEDWHGQELSQVQRDWGYRISVTGSNPAYTAQDAFRLTQNAQSKGLAFCYINDRGYNSLAPWLEEFAYLQNNHKLPIGN